jgi:hypothetical protein
MCLLSTFLTEPLVFVDYLPRLKETAQGILLPHAEQGKDSVSWFLPSGEQPPCPCWWGLKLYFHFSHILLNSPWCATVVRISKSAH